MVATATKPRTKKSADPDSPTPKLILPVQFGDVSIGDGTAAVGVTIQRGHLNILTADESLCCKRLVGKILILPGDDDEDQTYINDAKVKYRVQGAFDVRSFRVTPKTLTTRLSFSIESIDVAELSHFAKKSGKLVADLIVAIPEEQRPDAKGQRQLELDGPADKQDIAMLDVTVGIIAKLRDKGVTTMGQLAKLIESKELSSIIKTKDALAEVEDASFRFFRDHPAEEGESGEDEEEGDSEE